MNKHKRHYLGEELYSFIHHFTKDELDDFAQRMAQGDNDIRELEEEKKRVADEYKFRIEATKLEVSQCARKYREKSEQQSTKCLKYADYNTGEIVWQDKETKEERGRRPMVEEEKQMPLLPTPEPMSAMMEQ